MAATRLLRAKRSSQADIARELGVSRASVTRWNEHLEHEGLRGLRPRRCSGRPPSLSIAQRRHPFRTVRRGARVAGFDAEQWTRRRIAAVIQREFGISYHAHPVSRALRVRG